MAITGPSFKISDQSSVQSLDSFLKTNADRGATILGKKDASGAITLYTSSGAVNKLRQLADRILGRTEQRQNVAKDGIKQLFSRLETSTTAAKGFSAVGQAASDTLFSHIGQVLDHKAKAGITGQDIRDLRKAAVDITRRLPTATAQATAVPKGPGLPTGGQASPTSQIPGLAQQLASGIAGQTDTGPIADRWGDDCAQHLRGTTTDAKGRVALAMTSGTTMKEELLAGLKASLAAMTPPVVVDDGVLAGFANRAVDRALAQVMDDRAVDGTSTRLPHQKIDLPNIVIGGQEYKPTAFLGEGGFADVFEYTSVSDPAEKIAFKLMKDVSGEAHADVASEIAAHQAAFGTAGCDQVVGFEGALRLPDGRLGIAIEIAPNGTVHDMGGLVFSSIDRGPQVAPGKIAPDEAKIVQLTMLKDMALGLQHLHDSSGTTHYDFKSPNCFIGSDGTIKIGDFGLTLGSTDVALDDAGDVDNPFFKAPELIRAEDVRSRIDKEADDNLKVETRAAKRQMAGLLPLANQGTLDILATSILDERSKTIDADKASDRSMLFVDNKVDVWGLGASALEMFTGSGVLKDETFMSEATRQLIAFGASRANDPLADAGADGKVPRGAIGLKTGDTGIDDLLRSMLKPDPRDRATASSLLASPTLSTAGVGSAEAKSLIVALKSGDAGRIDAARQALRAQM